MEGKTIFTEAEKQLLIFLSESSNSKTIQGCAFPQEWLELKPALADKGLLASSGELTPRGDDCARQLLAGYSSIYYWYREYYRAIQFSQAHSEYCQRVFGQNFAQHGFCDQAQLMRLLEILSLNSAHSVLELGCGNGGMLEYLSDQTGAHCVGVDFIPEAIAQAQDRTQLKRDRLSFQIGEIGANNFKPESFDVILAVDSLYFPQDLTRTVGELRQLLKPGGRIAAFYSVFFNSLADETDLALAFQQQRFEYEAWELTQANYEHLRRRRQVAQLLQKDYEREGNAFIYENILAESLPETEPFNPGMRWRYLYLARLAEA